MCCLHAIYHQAQLNEQNRQLHLKLKVTSKNKFLSFFLCTGAATYLYIHAYSRMYDIAMHLTAFMYLGWVE